MDEAGDPTPKFMALRAAILEYLPHPNVSVPDPVPKMKLPVIRLTASSTLLSDSGRRSLGSTPIYSQKPLSFEALNQFSGFVLYETVLPYLNVDPCNLVVDKLNDRAHVFVDGVCSHSRLFTIVTPILIQMIYLFIVFPGHLIQRK